MSKALYRKYRPKNLAEIIGQSHITSTLQNSISSNKISHAYLLIGPRGTGKTSVARILAHEINGFNYELEDEYLDIIEIDAASNTGVDNIRSLREKSLVAPTTGKYKIYIIDEVHMLSRSAFNALLKTLEEPPAHVVFIMATTDAHKVPITITSRSQTFTFKLTEESTMTAHLASIARKENIKIDNDALKIIARRGGGSFRDSISLLDQISTISTETITAKTLETALGLPGDELTDQLLSAYHLGDLTSASQILQKTLENGLKPEIIAEELILKILKNPTPPLLNLLDALTQVSSSNYPNVKLLLAILKSPEKPSAFYPATNLSPQPQSQPQPQPQPQLASPPPITHPVKDHITPIDKPQPASLSFDTFMDTIKKDNAATYALLTSAEITRDAHTITIYQKSKMVRDKITAKKSYLSSLLPENTEIIITDINPNQDPLLSQLSSIFGDVKEVKLDHD